MSLCSVVGNIDGSEFILLVVKIIVLVLGNVV